MRGKLNTQKVRGLVTPGIYGDGGGLWLQVRGPDKRSWLYRWGAGGRRYMGLGPVRDVTLSEARDIAAAARKLVRQGIDPIEHRRAARARQAGADGHSFAEVAEHYIAAHEIAWRNAKHRQQWTNTLAQFANPVIGKLPVGQITTEHILRCLTPLWVTRTETASRTRGRIEAVIDFARSRGWCEGENPARWRGHLANLLPPKAKVAHVRHHAALPWQDVPALVQEVSSDDSIPGLALRFLILTAARTAEVLGARWAEVDPTAKVWTVPAARMKSAREHRVPLSDAALNILHEVEPLCRGADAPVFPGMSLRRPMAGSALRKVLQRLGRGQLTVHGLRSSFRDWAADNGEPDTLAELALAHIVGDRTARAYQRSDLFERRRALMERWAAHCLRPPEDAVVVPLRALGQ